MVYLLELYQYAYSFSEKEEGVFLDGLDVAVAWLFLEACYDGPDEQLHAREMM